MTLKSLPVGIQTFRKIIEGGYLYVDKTKFIYSLIERSSGAYFLSRPRRFGKSLLLSTLDEIFQGNRQLFEGLWLGQSEYQWSVHPVIRLDFGLQKAENSDHLRKILATFCREIADSYGMLLPDDEYPVLFRSLIRQLSQQSPVVILIDEYDKPILDNIANLEEARQIREVLKGFYGVIKSLDAHIRFVFLTGISKFSKVGVFSGLNNLEDLTFDPRFATLLGITESEIDQFFTPYMADFAQKKELTIAKTRQTLRDWYNGFCFAPDSESVYNPFSLLLVLKQQRFSNFWFESGTPTFLIDLIRDKQYDVQELEQLELDELGFSAYELENLSVIPLLYQMGYLTIKAYDPESQFYRLDYPNYEVRHAFSRYLLQSFSRVEQHLAAGYLLKMVRALQANDLPNFFEVLQVFFANIPYDIQIKQERYYQTVFYLIFKLIGLQVEAEVRTDRGRIDALVGVASGLYLFEFKLEGDEQMALNQMRERGYGQKYGLESRPVHLVGVGFQYGVGISGWVSEQLK